MPQLNLKKHASWQSALPDLALICTFLVVILLGIRVFISYDLGYHLAFGETFFDTGTIVDHTPYIYTLPAPDTPVAERPAPGPGSWYDNQGLYRFTNSSWLSQLIIYGAWDLGGTPGLAALRILIIGALFMLLIVAMLRSRLPTYLIALSLLFIGVIINSRLNLRPELFGYLCLAAQYTLLCKLAVPQDPPAPPSWSWVGGMVVLELLFVNFHSYFLLGLAITGAVLAEYCLYAAKERLTNKDLQLYAGYKKVVYRLGVTLAAMTAACFINPWGWRLALQPFQTLLYMKRHGIGGRGPSPGTHPWNYIPELGKTLPEHWPTRLSDYAIWLMLLLGAAAILFQLTVWILNLRKQKHGNQDAVSSRDTYRIRLAHLFMIAGMLLVGFKMRRNIGVASLIVVPSALVAITTSLRHFQDGKSKHLAKRLPIFVSTLAICLSLFGGYLLVSGKLYEEEHLPTRFGFGLSNTILPVGAARWLDLYAPDARIWCDFQNSSTLHFFTHPHREVPILTNTWAYPPEVMAQSNLYLAAALPFQVIADKYDIDVVVLRSDWSSPLHEELGADSDWKMVYVEGVNVMYMRDNKKYGAVARKFEIRPGNFNPDTFVAQQIGKDPSFDRAILKVSNTLQMAGKQDLAIALIEAGLKRLKPNLKVWKTLYGLYSTREAQRREEGDKRCVNDLIRMKYVIGKILELEPANADLQYQLKVINRISSMINSQ